MIVTLMYKETTNTIILPNKKEGQFWIGTKNKKEIISVEGSQNKWILKSNKKVKILDKDKKQLKTIELEENSITALDIEGRIALIFTEPLTSDRQIFTKKIVDKELSITIGRSEENAICFNNNFVSSIHARLIYHNKYWLIKDNNSINGVYVNGKKERTKDLEFGDVIYIMGLKIIVFYDFIMINNPDNLVTLKDELFKNPLKQSLEILNDEDEEVEDDEIQREYFYRSPRFKRDIEKVDLKIDEPPSIANGERLPTALTLGPAITMGLASLTTAIFSINTAITSGDFERYVPTMAMSISMLLGTLLWPTVTKVYEKIMIKRKEKLRQEKYTEYLKSIENKLKQEKQKQEKILKENFVTIDECEERILSTKRNLWERGLWQDDFLKIRLGTGDIPLDINLIYNERKFLLNEDPLLEKMYEICEKPTILENVPITVSLYEEYICGVIGDQNKRNEFAKGMIFQLASLYSYDEVKMIFLYNESDKDDFHFVKWLPHTFSNDKSFRFIATNLDELKEISYYLDEEIANRSQLNETEIEDALPYYVIFALDKNLALKSELLTQIYSKKQNLNFSVINFCEQLQELPKECSTVIELYQRDAKIYDKDDMSGNYTTFKPDIYLTADPNKLSKKLANTLLNTLESEYKLPTLINFLQMFQVGKIEHLNVLSRWQENDPTKSLATPIGIDTYGELFKLDLHEKFHGPHGLIAGMTGSGKSEFIITYILSLAVNYHPNEVAFILIDYKGGGMAKAFEKLPHVSGIITNLDGASINRALISIDSELKRRQKIFDETSKKIQVSNIDIYKYQRLYREKRVDQPMPHLFIISDEFAELKSQQPEFMTQLISTARIGRSLGVHLILATQKPNGVVNDQIWSNSKFKICLKVQEKADSMDMIKRPDAAMLKETGRFYLQVGYNELFELGQSAWAGAQYYPTDKYIKEKDDSVVIIDNNARVLKDIKINKNKYKKNTPKQLDAITEYLYNISVNENINAKPIWLEPINPNIILEEIQNKYKIQEQDFYINPIIGEYDDPINQRQCYLRIPISENGNVLIYGSLGSGKNMLLTTMIYSIITKYSPEEVNLYLLDFETETLNAFEEAPHIGDVMLSNDNEKITNLLKTLYKEIEIRKKNFTNFGGTYLRYIEESEKKLPNIIVIISNYAAFSEMYPDKEEALNYLTREGSKYGIYFVVTANSTNAMKLRMSQNFSQTISLQFNDETIYSMILGKTNGLVPQHYEGRGLIKLDKTIYEFQTAHITNQNNEYKFIKQECIKILEKYGNNKASKIAVLPKKITTDILEKYISNNLNIPIGMEKNTLEISYFKIGNHYINQVLSEDNSYKQFLKDLANFISKKYNNLELTLIDEQNEIQNLDENIIHIVGKTSAENCIDDLYNLILERNNEYKTAIEENRQCAEFSNKIIIINSIRNLLENKDEERVQKLELALEKGSKNYNVNFIIFDELKRISIVTAKKWYKEHVKSDEGIWIGRGFSNQYNFNISNNTIELKRDITDKNFAILIEKGIAKIIKILNSKEESEE